MTTSADAGARRGATLCALAAASVCALFYLFFGRHSWHPTDYEMLLGFSWRVVSGAVPYRDFLYVRPPLSLYLHAVWLFLPDVFVISLSRAFYYAQFAASAAVPIAWAMRAGVLSSGGRAPLFMAAGCALALHNFPIIPWYTVDGVFFSSLGLTAFLASLQAPRLLWRAVASLGFVSAALCKQNFGALPALLCLFAVVELALRWRERGAVARCAATIGPALAAVAGVVAWLLATGALADFRHQVFGASHGVLRSGLLIYVPHVAFLAVGVGLGLLRALPRGDVLVGRAVVVAVVAVVAWCTVPTLRAAYSFESGCRVELALVGLLVGRALSWRRLRAALDPQRELLGMVLLGGVAIIAWEAGISWGYQTPLLGLVACGPLLADALPRARSVALDVVPAALLALLVVRWGFELNVRAPYRDRPIPAQTADLGAAFPKLAGITTSPGALARYGELRALLEEHALGGPRPFVVMHEYPAIHWLTGTQSPASIDWFWPPDYAGSEDRLLRELDEKKPIVFLMRERKTPGRGEESADHIKEVDAPHFIIDAPPCPELFFPPKRHSVLSKHVVEHGRPIGGGTYFCVFSLE